ncbi:DUF58 domain-containing protein [Vibrio rumoiensis]|uniref:MoxR protein n=1 Tax=Vibrio rumoiensis 1S-45 TaxID=1188252 RepID=A0A1E5E2F9_9VIBR|nr:DUF58 domain-containing protein [Vibrio rumoiensis]OEF25584.1 MoxR protein [Vibrio rumoiensis 1S-45]
MATQVLDPRIYSDFSQLVRLQSQAHSFSFLPKMNAGTALAGRHNSRFRGRGLNFEELRHYQLGDDIRNLDWKVTIRTGKPHVRMYTEEKDRNVLVAVDQRSGMFFSSTSVMKSVVAAEIAALTGWRVLKDNDRVGFSFVTPERIVHHKAQRSQNDLLRELRHVARYNQDLNVGSKNISTVHFSDWLKSIAQLKLKAATIVIISDWHDTSEQDIKRLQHLQQHNDVLSILVSDPMEQSLPDHTAKSRWVIGDGQYQLSLDSQSKVSAANESLLSQSNLKRDQLVKIMAMNKMPLIELDTQGDHIKQFKRSIGGMA